MMKMGFDWRRENLFIIDEVVVIILYKAEVILYWDIMFIERVEDSILRVFSNIYIYHAAYMSLTYLLMVLFSDHRYYWGFKFEDIHW